MDETASRLVISHCATRQQLNTKRNRKKVAPVNIVQCKHLKMPNKLELFLFEKVTRKSKFSLMFPVWLSKSLPKDFLCKYKTLRGFLGLINYTRLQKTPRKVAGVNRLLFLSSFTFSANSCERLFP